MPVFSEPSSTMTAAIVERFGEPYVIKQIPRPPSPTGKDILIKVLAASYCHTDSVFASGGLAQDLPRIGCHEFAGEVVAIGEDVTGDRGVEIGVRVGVPGRTYHPCGSCYECTNSGQDEIGYSPYCPHAGNLGLTRDGGFQEYCFVDSRQVAPLPESLAATQAAPLMCAGLTIWAALHHDKVQASTRVGIIGAGGGLGHLGVQFAAHLNKEVFAIDANDGSLKLLERIKQDLGDIGSRVHVINARTMAVDEMKTLGRKSVGSLPSEQGLDSVILLPESQKAFDMGMDLLRNHGSMVVISFPKEKLQVSAHDLVFRDISIVGSLVGRNHQLREMLDFVTQHRIVTEVKTFPFSQLNNLVEESNRGVGGKLVIDMSF